MRRALGANLEHTRTNGDAPEVAPRELQHHTIIDGECHLDHPGGVELAQETLAAVEDVPQRTVDDNDTINSEVAKHLLDDRRVAYQSPPVEEDSRRPAEARHAALPQAACRPWLISAQPVQVGRADVS